MFDAIAARPRTLLAALLSTAACDGDEAMTSSTAGTTSVSSTSTSADGSSTQGPTTGGEDAGSSTSGASSSSGGTDAESSSGERAESSGGDALGYADLAGDYVELFRGGMTTHTLTPQAWTLDFGTGPIAQSVVEVDDEARWVVLEDDEMGTYLRNDWTLDGDGVLRYCTAGFGAMTAQEAIEAPPSDPRDLDGAGCGGSFPWSALEPAP